MHAQEGNADGTISLAQAAALLAACSPCRHWRRAALGAVGGAHSWHMLLEGWLSSPCPKHLLHTTSLQVSVRLHISAPGDLADPLLGLLPCAELSLEPQLSAGLNRPLAEPLHALLGSAAFRGASGGTLTTLRCLPGEALEWGSTLAPYTALDSASFDAGDSWLKVPGAQLGPGWLGRFSHVRITARCIDILCASLPPPPPVEGSADAWRLMRLLEACEPALRGSRVRSLALECHVAALMFPGSPERARPGDPLFRLLLLSRNVQHLQGIVLSTPDRPLHLVATRGCLAGAFRRPAPGHDDAVLIDIQRQV